MYQSSCGNNLINATFKMSKNQYWRQNTLIVPKIPEIYANSAVGMPAKDLLDHPIAEYLGAVKRITTIRELSRITFKNEYEAIPHEKFLNALNQRTDGFKS
jgi:hypothetical protein